jgi:anti-anti-sigma factor
LSIRRSRRPAETDLVDFKLDTTVVGKTAVIVVRGELDLHTVRDFLPLAHEALADQRQLIVDLTACTFIDATSITQIIELAEAPRARVAAVVPHRTQMARVFLLVETGGLGIEETRGGALSWMGQPA